ncbi:MAG TPA: DUF262 domain-containing protein [Pyrinomonadaceae bacterium]|nr:DUF262 domain-containing protein [Pyrinomonadaceae bacterium]
MTAIDYKADQKTVQEILNLYEKDHLNLEPGFQRSSVWALRDREKLIDSILRTYPLPSIFLYRRYDQGNLVYDVIDGKQRIESILMFTGALRGNRFQTRARLPGEERPDWLDWNTIKRKKLQYLITGYNLQIIEVTGELADIIDLFVRINSTGKALTGQEKRHARYYHSGFLRKAGQLAKRYEDYFRAAKILSPMQISRMKHVELMCELMVAAHSEDVTNKKAALDKVMDSDSIRGRDLDKAAALAVTGLNRLRNMFPKLYQTRFHQLSDFYSLAILIQKFERQRLILNDRKRNRLAWDLLVAFSTGVDKVRLRQKEIKATEPGQELYREYLLTVLQGTDEISQRKKRVDVLCGLLEPLFLRKDRTRAFSKEQRRILWNSTEAPRCAEGNHILTWDDFTVDHVDPWSKGGHTSLENADLMCRRHNSRKGNRSQKKAA